MNPFDEELPPAYDPMFDSSFDPMGPTGPMTVPQGPPAPGMPGPPQLAPLPSLPQRGPEPPPMMRGPAVVPNLPPPLPLAPMMTGPIQAFAGPGDAPVALENGHTLGLAVLLSGIGATAGLVYGGMFGGIAGGLAGGSVVNLLRAYKNVVKGTPEGDREATISGTYGVLGLGASAFLFYKAKSSPRRPNEPSEEAPKSNLRGVR